MAYSRLAREGQARGPVVLDHLERELRQQTPAAAEINVGGESLATRELFDAQREPLQQHLRIGAEKLGNLAVLLGGQQALGVPELARLRLLVAETECQREAARECAPAEVEHSRPLNASVAHERYVGGAAADIDEDPALGPCLLAGASTRERIRLCDRGCKPDVEPP